ncbi:hypothetical protein, partial [Streptomyces sp. NPDC056045]|uniref:hypothetical protein n=1 Tax=Streptomyces sp. NPDC056045 TaxID=3345691 RepID=UPI0035E01AC2
MASVVHVMAVCAGKDKILPSGLARARKMEGKSMVHFYVTLDQSAVGLGKEEIVYKTTEGGLSPLLVA